MRAVATLKEVPDAPATAVEGLGVDAVQVAHTAGEVGIERAHEQVVVVRHQAVAQAAPPEALECRFQDFQEGAPVAVVSVDRATLVPARGQVEDSVSYLQPEGARHYAKVASPRRRC